MIKKIAQDFGEMRNSFLKPGYYQKQIFFITVLNKLLNSMIVNTVLIQYVTVQAN